MLHIILAGKKVVVLIPDFSKRSKGRVNIKNAMDEEEHFIIDRIEVTCSHDTFSAEEVTYFFCYFLQCMFSR